MSRSLRWGLLAAGALAGWRWVRRTRRLRLPGKVALVTGGTRGLGWLVGRELGQRGATVVLAGRDADALKMAVQRLENEGVRAAGFACDVREAAQVEALMAHIGKLFGRLDVLVNNAGVIQVSPLEHLTPDEFHSAMAVHVWGPLNTTRAAVSLLRRSGQGRIVNIASVGGKVAVPHMAAYCASKFGLVGLSDALRAELGSQGIAVTTVCPGLMRTGSHRKARFKGQHDREYTWFAALSALPLMSVDGSVAARRIVEACVHGDPSLTISPQAKIAAALQGIAPGLVAHATQVIAHLLPAPATEGGDEVREGGACQLVGVPDWVLTLQERAAQAYNET